MARDGSNDGRRWRRFFLIPLVACTGAALGLTAAVAASGSRTTDSWAWTAAGQLAQSRTADQDKPIPPAEVQKYVAVYTAMQRDHKLTIEQAVAREGMTLSQFRSLEYRIERNPAVHERVIRQLRAAAKIRAQKASPKHNQ